MTKSTLFIFTFILFSGCIGDAYMTVGYTVKNKTDKTVEIKFKKSPTNQFEYTEKDTIILIPSQSDKIIYQQRFACLNADCRLAMQSDRALDSLEYCFTDKRTEFINVSKGRWIIKKRRAVLTIKK